MHEWQEVPRGKMLSIGGHEYPARWYCARCGNIEIHEYKPDADKKYFYPVVDREARTTSGVYLTCDGAVVRAVMES